MHKFILALPLLAMGAPLWAQTDTERKCATVVDEDQAHYTECEIVVFGGLPSPDGEAVLSTVSVESDNFRVENALRAVPNLQQFRRSDARSANPTSQGVTMRGLGGNASGRALLLLDGVPQSDPFGGWIAWPGYDAYSISSIDVQRGGGSVSNGPGALAGTINLTSDIGRVSMIDGDELTGISADYVRASLFYGSRNSLDGKFAVRKKLGEGQIGISASYARGDGFIPIIESQRGTVDRSAEYQQAGLAVRYVAPLNDDTELQANVRAFTDDRQRGFAFSDIHTDGADASIRLVNRDSDWQWSALAYAQIRNFNFSVGSVSADRSSVNRVFEQFNVPSTGLGARFEVRPPLGDNTELRLGGDWRYTEGVTNENFFFLNNDTPRRSRRAGGDSSTYGIFAELSTEISNALTLTGGARADFWSIDNGFRREIELINPFPGAERSSDIFADRSGTEFTGRGGFAFDATDELTIRGAAYLGWRLPTLNELFRPFRVGADATAANELLDPERLKGVELGLDWENGDASFSITAFYNELNDTVANVTLANGPGVFPGVGFVSGAGVYRQRQNLDSVESKGLELDANIALDSLVEGLSLRVAYSYVDAEVNASTTAVALDGLHPAQVPKHSASSSLGWEGNDGHSAAVFARYIGSQFEDDLNLRRLDDAFTVDGQISVRISRNLQMELRAENLFNSRVEAAISGTGILERAFPRTFWIGLRTKIE